MTRYLFLLFFFFTNFVRADYTPPVKYSLASAYGGASSASVQSVCSDALSKISGAVSLSSCSENSGVAGGDTYSRWYEILASYQKSNGTSTGWLTVGYVVQTCTAPSYRANGVIPPNVICTGTAPPDPCLAKKDQPANWFNSVVSGSDQCVDSCLARMSSGDCGGTGAQTRCHMNGFYTGVSCLSSANAPPTPAPCPECDCIKAGKGYGTVNGAVVCTSKGSIGSTPTTSIKAGAKTTSTPAPTAENPNPTPVVTTQPPVVVTTTPAPAGSPPDTPPAVSSSSTNPDGSKSTTDESKDSFCSKNPASEQCQAKSLCEKSPDSPSCKNICQEHPDLLVCKQTDIDQLCKDHPDRMECKDIEDILGKVSDIPQEDIETKSVVIGEDITFGTVNIPSMSGCPAPRSVAIAGHAISINYDWICSYASVFYKLEAIAALMAAISIIVSAIKSDSQPYQRSLF